MADENDFLLKVGADDSDFRKTVDKLYSDFKAKPVVIDIKGKIDPNLQKTLSSISSLKGGNSGSRAGSDMLAREQRNSLRITKAFNTSLNAAILSLNNFTAKLSKGPVAPTFSGTPAGMAVGGVTQGLMALPGAVQLAGMVSAPIMKGIAFGKGAVSAYNTQNRAELQLKQVLKNSGMGEADFNAISAHAASLQNRTTIGDEAMIAGAGELSTYVKDGESMKRMMNLLADYAIGMNENSPEVNNHMMVEFATSLGKAFDGTYDAMRKKGFDTSELEALKKREDAGLKVTEGDKIAALERALKDWNGLAENIAKTDEGKIVQLNNKIGDLKENVGRQLLPAIGRLGEALSKNLPSTENFFNAFTNAGSWFIDVGANVVDSLEPIVKVFSEIAETASRHMVPVIGGLVIGFGTLTGAMAKMQAQLIRTSMAMLTSGGGGGVAGELGKVAGGIDSLKGAAGSVLKAGMLGILAAEVLAIGDAAWKAWKASSEARKNAENEAKRTANLDPMLDAYAKYKQALKDQNAGDIVSWRQELESQAQAYHSKTGGALPSQVAEALGWDLGATSGVNNPVQGPKPPKVTPPAPQKITQNNYISTEFDSLGKLIKENLREIAVSRLTFKTSSEAAKAMAI